MDIGLSDYNMTIPTAAMVTGFAISVIQKAVAEGRLHVIGTWQHKPVLHEQEVRQFAKDVGPLTPELIGM